MEGGESHHEPLRCPDRLRGCGGQKRGPVVPFGFLNCFEVGRPGRACGLKAGSIEPVYLRGVEGGVVSFPELRVEIRPSGLEPVSNPFYRDVESQLRCYSAQVCFEPDIHRPGGGEGRGRRDRGCFERGVECRPVSQGPVGGRGGRAEEGGFEVEED